VNITIYLLCAFLYNLLRLNSAIELVQKLYNIYLDLDCSIREFEFGISEPKSQTSPGVTHDPAFGVHGP